MSDARRVAAALVDERLGLVRRLTEDRRRGGMPSGQHQWIALASDSTRFGAPPVDRLGFGNATDPGAARMAALAEAVERYCGNLVPPGLPAASWHDLTSAGRCAVDPEVLALFSADQYAGAGFPFVPFTRDSAVPWVPGRDLTDGRDVLVPASLVYLNVRGAPATNPLVYAGIATGPTATAAALAALYEVVERDATAIWWAARGPSTIISDGDTVVAAFDDLAAEDRTVRLHAIPSQFDLPVVAAFVEDHRRRLIGFGTACRPDPVQAAAKALTEAFGLLEVAADLADPQSPVWAAVREGNLPAGLFKPFRPDRAYRHDFGPGHRDLVDLPGVVQLYLDPEAHGEPLDRLRRHDRTTTLAGLDRAAGTDDDALATTLERVHTAGLQAVAVDLTTPDVTEAGLHVVRVVVPGTYSNSPPAYPYLGGTRLHDVPRTLGWSAPADLCLTPIPLG